MSSPSWSSPVRRRWFLRRQDLAAAQAIAGSVQVSPLLGQLLLNRGVASPEAARSFLSAGLAELADPFLAMGMERAVDRVAAALSRGEAIAVYGDYDVDGITATSLLLLFLRSLGARVEGVVPNRVEDGYGLSSDAVRRLAGRGVGLIITVDCGISCRDEVALARSLGVDVVVTDHHQPPALLPDAAALVNPLLPGCGFPEKGLAGVGLAFYLAAGVRKGLRDRGFFAARPEPDLGELLDLVALGTIADMVPLAGLNRILVRAGLARLNRSPRPGVAALLDVSGVAPGEVGADSVAFRLAPRVNAAGRLADPSVGVRLLTTTDPLEAGELALELDGQNRERQRLEEEIFVSALRLAEESAAGEGRSLVLYHPDWHPGVIGIVASRLAERFFRPTVLLSGREDDLKGSARSIPAFHLYEGLASCGDLLTEFGGHRHAAGLRLRATDLRAFAERFEKAVCEVVPPGGGAPPFAVDAPVAPADLTLEAMEGLGRALAPLGAGNPEPVLFLAGVRATSPRVVGNGHLLFTASAGGCTLPAIAFRQAHERETLSAPVDLAVAPEVDAWRGTRRLRLRVRALRPAAPIEME